MLRGFALHPSLLGLVWSSIVSDDLPLYCSVVPCDLLCDFAMMEFHDDGFS